MNNFLRANINVFVSLLQIHSCEAIYIRFKRFNILALELLFSFDMISISFLLFSYKSFENEMFMEEEILI